MINITNVTKKYGSLTAVDNISLEIKDNEIFGFLGPNGAGKSTTLKMTTGIIPIDSGDIRINNISIKDSYTYEPDPFGRSLGSDQACLVIIVA